MCAYGRKCGLAATENHQPRVFRPTEACKTIDRITDTRREPSAISPPLSIRHFK